MTNAEESMSDFMIQKNKENLGEEIKAQEGDDDNFLDERARAMNRFEADAVSKDDRGMLMVKKAINSVITVFLFLVCFGAVLYFIMKIGPSILAFIRRIMIGIFI